MLAAGVLAGRLVHTSRRSRSVTSTPRGSGCDSAAGAGAVGGAQHDGVHHDRVVGATILEHHGRGHREPHRERQQREAGEPAPVPARPRHQQQDRDANAGELPDRTKVEQGTAVDLLLASGADVNAAEQAARKRRNYTAAERVTILKTADRVGPVEAARHHGVPQTTVSNWLHRDAMRRRRQ
jgi:hypothetical protein